VGATAAARYTGTSAQNQDYGDRTKMTPKLTHERIAQMIFASIYPLYVNKVEKKGRTEADLQKVITWLTGFTKAQIKKHITAKTTFEEFFKKAKLNPNASKIKGVICGYRVEEIEDPLTQKCRYLDKLIDELARGKKMENILRS
jgi:hypothetical protein